MNAAVPVRTVLFDLDGTLLDTAPDLAAALNAVLAARGRAPLPFAQVRPVVSHGARALIELGFGVGPEDAAFDDLRAALLAHYRAHLAEHTRPFPGMETVLAELEARGLAWGVVTNKPAGLTEPLLQALGLWQRAATVVSGDTLPQRKPHPAPMLLACEHTGCDAGQCVYVGDARRDVEAGRAAGMHTLVALFGYIEAHEDPRTWDADALVASPGEILDWLGGRDDSRAGA